MCVSWELLAVCDSCHDESYLSGVPSSTLTPHLWSRILTLTEQQSNMIITGSVIIISCGQVVHTHVPLAFSALTLLVGQQEGHPASNKLEWWGAGVVICLERGADLHTVQLMPLPLTVSCFSKIQIGFTFLVPAHLVVPEKGPLNGMYVCNWLFQLINYQNHWKLQL